MRRIRRFLIAGILTLAAAASAAGQEAGDLATPFSVRDLVEGTPAVRDLCSAAAGMVWVAHPRGTECLATYATAPPPTAGQPGPDALVIYLHGDRLAGRKPIGPYDAVSPATLLGEMRRQASRPGVVYLLLARPGVFGSSGDHKQRRRAKEFHSIAVAIEALRERYRQPRIVLVGQSGGSAAIGAVLTLGAKGIRCAVMGSGLYAVNARAEFRRKLAGQKPQPGCDVTGYCDAYQSIDHVAGIAHETSRRLIVVGDPRDQNTPFDLQLDWAAKLRAAGHAVEVVEAEGRGPEHHNVSRKSFEIARSCLTSP